LTVPIDISDPTLVRAYAHPLRRQILGLLDNRIASPSEIAAELGTPLSNTSYHVRQLLALGLVELVSRTARRGAIEHHYTAKVRPTTTDEAWDQLPDIVKRAVIDGWLQQIIKHLLAAAVDGGFDRNGTHHTRTVGPLDEKGWKTISRELSRTLKRVDEAIEESRERIDADPETPAVDATVVLMQFEGPAPQNSTGRPRRRKKAEDLTELELDEASDLG
jgi:DNA-binding transcriptional ArsR family regulator